MMSYMAPTLTPTSGNPTLRVYDVEPVTFGILVVDLPGRLHLAEAVQLQGDVRQRPGVHRRRPFGTT